MPLHKAKNLLDITKYLYHKKSFVKPLASLLPYVKKMNISKFV